MKYALSFLAVMYFGGAAVAQTVDPITEVRTLYNSAAYEDALAKLDTVQGAPIARVEQYRSFCLLALGRRDEAVASLAKAIDADPFWEPTGDASPRVQTFYAEQRRKRLPDIARGAYAEARAAYVAKNYPVAIAGFTRVRELIATASGGADLSDLGLLAGDFLNLARVAASPAPTAAVEPRTAAAPQGRVPAPAAVEMRNPVAINQKLPTWTRTTWLGNTNGLLHIEIDDSGAVTQAVIVRPTQPQYDLRVLEAARSWRYEPAVLNGRAVPSSKDISFVLRP